MTDAVIDIQDLWFAYNGRPVLKGVTLTVPPSDFVALIGPNGGGKTTLLKLILGLYRPGGGRIRVLGVSPRKAAPRVGYVPQYVHINPNFPVSVMDVVLMGRLRPSRRWRFFSDADRSDAQQAMTQMGVWDLRHRKMSDLSGGQRQRVVIARALMTRPEIVVLDEPTANMDAAGQTELYALLKKMNRTKTIIVATHDLMVLSTHVKTVACINRTLMHHTAGEVTGDMLEMAYHCPVELVAHGLPHRVLCTHDEE